jgi:hypothetical protein
MTAPSGPAGSSRSAVPGAGVIDGVDVDAVAAAVRACAGVAGLDGGQYGEFATYLPGRTIPGIRVSGGRVAVQIRSEWVPAPGLAALITTVLAPLTGRRPVDVLIADIDDPAGVPDPRRPSAGAYPAAGPLT